MRPQLLAALKAKKMTRVHQMPASPKPLCLTKDRLARTRGSATAITLKFSKTTEPPLSLPHELDSAAMSRDSDADCKAENCFLRLRQQLWLLRERSWGLKSYNGTHFPEVRIMYTA